MENPAAQLADALREIDGLTKLYFNSQSSVIHEFSGETTADREELLEKVNESRMRFGLEPLPRPDWWILPEDED
jgi:hypothetical protein